jgi:hypothetical protein
MIAPIGKDHQPKYDAHMHIMRKFQLQLLFACIRLGFHFRSECGETSRQTGAARLPRDPASIQAIFTI